MLNEILGRALLRFRLLVWRWKLLARKWRKPKSSLDYMGESIRSMTGCWHGELDPFLTYVCLFDVLRQNRFEGELLELGGGYSTVLFKTMFASNQAKITSVDLNPTKYNRILNSVKNTQGFLASINSIKKPTVSLSEAIAGLESLRVQLKEVPCEELRRVLANYVPDQLEEIVACIVASDGLPMRELFSAHHGYEEDLHFYESNNYLEGKGYCSELRETGVELDAVFFDCGEVSSVGEWSLLSDQIRVGGYALFHDIFYPKSIKNFLVVALVELSSDWEVLYIDKLSRQGGMVARRTSQFPSRG